MKEVLKKKLKEAMVESVAANNNNFDDQSLPKSIFIIPTIVFILILIGTYFLNPYSNVASGPHGKIELPKKGTTTGKEVRVIGETRNIQEGQYIWLAVDKPDVELCWPKKHIASNTKFSTTILEEGPEGEFILTLYALNENYRKQWREWQDREIFGGLPIPPKNKKLTMISMTLKRN